MTGWYWSVGWLPSLLAVVGNGLVIYLVLTRRKLRTTANKFILSLAIADFCVGACLYPGHAMCQFVFTSCNEMIQDDIAVLMIYSSVSNLCAMTLDHFIAIVNPLRYTSVMTSRRATMVTIVAWMVPLSIFFIPSVCSSLDVIRMDFKISVIIWTSIFEFVPCVLLLLASIHILITSQKHYRRDTLLNSQLRYNRPDTKRPRSTSSTKVLVTVVATFLICYAVEVYSSFCYFTTLCAMNPNLYNVVRFLVIVNSAINPIAYALFKQDIKRELDRMFCQKFVRMKRNSELRTSV